MGHRPVHEKHGVSQYFAANPTGALPANHPTILAYGNYQPAGHTGMDFACPTGTPITAIADGGVVKWAGHSSHLPGDESSLGYALRYFWRKDFPGNCIAVEYDDIVVLTSHHDKLNVRAGQVVNAGTIIGTAGETGFSLGPHLHFETVAKPFNWGNGFYGRVDPLPFIRGAYREGNVAAQSVKPVPARPLVHVVGAGETLGAIAARYGTTVPAIVARNSYIKDPHYLNVGDRITLPESNQAVIHIVKPGETLLGIATKYGTTVPAIVARNKYITNPNYLNVGDRITLP